MFVNAIDLILYAHAVHHQFRQPLAQLDIAAVGQHPAQFTFVAHLDNHQGNRQMVADAVARHHLRIAIHGAQVIQFRHIVHQHLFIHLTAQ